MAFAVLGSGALKWIYVENSVYRVNNDKCFEFSTVSGSLVVMHLCRGPFPLKNLIFNCSGRAAAGCQLAWRFSPHPYFGLFSG